MRLSPFAKVRYLFAPGEYEGGEKRRATDPVWSLEIFELSHNKVSPDQPVMYYLSGGPKRSFVREELQVVPEDCETPPKNVKWFIALMDHLTFFFTQNKLSYASWSWYLRSLFDFFELLHFKQQRTQLLLIWPIELSSLSIVARSFWYSVYWRLTSQSP